MAAVPYTGTAFQNSGSEYNGKFRHNFGSIQHIPIISRIYIWYTGCILRKRLWYQTFQDVKF